MNKKMLIDAAHVEETRVAVIDEGGHLLDFDFASTTKQTIKGNVYLAKVARVEPSLQAAFIEYGGNRHGFLAFNEIHPDYFRIPMADRQALEAEIERQHKAAPTVATGDGGAAVNGDAAPEGGNLDESHGTAAETGPADAAHGGDGPVVDGDEADENPRPRRPSLHRLYKIQEVIQRGQVLLVQVEKEERGGKGAALTTYLSIAGRYCVFMPNSPRSGGISRKISVGNDRARLRKVLDELGLPDGMGLIIRTAGSERTKTEIKKDAEYLMRAWNNIREQTLQSAAPALIYEEDDIIKRAIRDLYTKEVQEIIVDGDEGYKIARGFMKNLLPSHVKKIQSYKDSTVPMFHRYGVERQMEDMHHATVRLPSGGSIVLHPTEALVSIDINSGRSTRERHIEETALKTNLEAADEIVRQVRLRDLAGLIVVDFIDMDDSRHVNAVERRMREGFKNDRARVQLGRISPFGLLELSRQRLRPSLLETSTHPCPHCHATGFIRSTESTSLSMLRVLEDEAMTRRAFEVLLEVPTKVAFYLLNTKRTHVQSIEQRHGIVIHIQGNDHLMTGHYTLNRVKKREDEALSPTPVPTPLLSSATRGEAPQQGPEISDDSSPVPPKDRRGKNVRPNRREDGAHDRLEDTSSPGTSRSGEDDGDESSTGGVPSSASAARRNRRHRARQRKRDERKRQQQTEGMSTDAAVGSADGVGGAVPAVAASVVSTSLPAANADGHGGGAPVVSDGVAGFDGAETPESKTPRRRSRRHRSRPARSAGGQEGADDGAGASAAAGQSPVNEKTTLPAQQEGHVSPSMTDGEGGSGAVSVPSAGPKNRQARGWLRRLLD